MKKIAMFLILIVTSLFSFTAESNAEEDLNIYGITDQQSVRSQLTAKEWTDFAENNNVPLKKAWTVTFNQEVTFDKLDGAVIEQNKQFIPVDISIADKNKITIKPVTRYDANSSYTLKLFLNNGKRYRMNFKTTMDLNTLLDPIKVATNPYHYEEQIIKVPAMPEKGFNFPYYIRVPSAAYKYHDGNNSSKR